MAKAKSISAASLSKLTLAAVKAATRDVSGKFTGKGATMGYILQQELSAPQQLDLAKQITNGVAANARAAGISGVRPQPVVVIRPGKIIAGFIAPELGVAIRG
jgi:hypothetical protein